MLLGIVCLRSNDQTTAHGYPRISSSPGTCHGSSSSCGCCCCCCWCGWSQLCGSLLSKPRSQSCASARIDVTATSDRSTRGPRFTISKPYLARRSSSKSSSQPPSGPTATSRRSLRGSKFAGGFSSCSRSDGSDSKSSPFAFGKGTRIGWAQILSTVSRGQALSSSSSSRSLSRRCTVTRGSAVSTEACVSPSKSSRRSASGSRSRCAPK
mmetsp:Transcript_10448/g.39485  ORF Transcript_10448/g.39485 Transcript_10448/m.39485 type:complete len:210 (+) Transcript_10448:2005-2634(+)